MEIEELSKSQIILLTLLVSFVTSIATGIVTVSLMDQAPPIVAQTVNRVIEHTIETVAPKGQAASTVVTQEKTVVVNESDLVSQAVGKVSASLVRIYSSDQNAPTFLGLGIVLDTQGTIVTDSGALGEAPDAELTLADGTQVYALVTHRDTTNGLAFMQATSTASTTPTWVPATLSSDQAVLGQSVVALSGKTIARIASGLVTAVASSTLIDTNIPADSILDGSPIIDTSGNIIGISTQASRDLSSTGFIAASLLITPPPKQ
jgi:S1-C subfamily serine protease